MSANLIASVVTGVWPIVISFHRGQSAEREQHMASTGQCFFCSVETGLQCQCGAWYCADQHLRVHRPGQYCLPFRVAFSDTVGRYLVASRDIKPLELVLWDTAAATGPCADSVPVCLECGDKVDGSYQCPHCQVRPRMNPKQSKQSKVMPMFSFLFVERSVLTRGFIKLNAKYFPNLKRKSTLVVFHQKNIPSTQQ